MILTLRFVRLFITCTRHKKHLPYFDFNTRKKHWIKALILVNIKKKQIKKQQQQNQEQQEKKIKNNK